MKVDKAVCTDTMTDTENVISYENLLSTLVQRKILAIKRDCEAKKVEKQRRKQQTCLGSLIFGKHQERCNAKIMTATDDGADIIDAVRKYGNAGDVTVYVEDDDDDGDNSNSNSGSGGHPGTAVAANAEQLYTSNPSISQEATVTDANNSHLKDDVEADADEGGDGDGDGGGSDDANNLVDNPEASSSVYSEKIAADTVAINFIHVYEMNSKWMEAENQNNDRDGDSDGRNESDNNTIQTIDTTHTDSNEQSVHIASSGSSAQLSIENSSDSHGMRINLSENVPLHTSATCDTGGGSAIEIERDIESFSPPAARTSTATGTNSKSSSIISQIEVSDECNPKQMIRTSHKNSGCSDTISMATDFIKRTTSSALSSSTTTADVSPLPPHDQEHQHHHKQEQQQQQRQQISHSLEAKSISAQCSPIFAQRMPTFTGKFSFCMWVCCALCNLWLQAVHFEGHNNNKIYSFVCV